MSDLMTVNEVAEQLFVHDSTVRRWIGEGKIEVVLLPHLIRNGYRIKREVFEKFSKEYKGEPNE
jgi:excisionase family DNA binding protein